MFCSVLLRMLNCVPSAVAVAAGRELQETTPFAGEPDRPFDPGVCQQLTRHQEPVQPVTLV
jgi:hypothetical protein